MEIDFASTRFEESFLVLCILAEISVWFYNYMQEDMEFPTKS